MYASFCTVIQKANNCRLTEKLSRLPVLKYCFLQVSHPATVQKWLLSFSSTSVNHSPIIHRGIKWLLNLFNTLRTMMSRRSRHHLPLFHFDTISLSLTVAKSDLLSKLHLIFILFIQTFAFCPPFFCQHRQEISSWFNIFFHPQFCPAKLYLLDWL